MSKVRVYEVAKKLNISTKEIMNKLKEYGFEVHSHMSTLEDEEAGLIIGYYQEVNGETDSTGSVEDKSLDINENQTDSEETTPAFKAQPDSTLSNIEDTQALIQSDIVKQKKNKK